MTVYLCKGTQKEYLHLLCENKWWNYWIVFPKTGIWNMPALSYNNKDRYHVHTRCGYDEHSAHTSTYI